MPVLPFAHLALYLFCNSPLFQVFLEDPFFNKACLHGPVSILHPFTIFKKESVVREHHMYKAAELHMEKELEVRVENDQRAVSV